jgi:hypothetical protein
MTNMVVESRNIWMICFIFIFLIGCPKYVDRWSDDDKITRELENKIMSS